MIKVCNNQFDCLDSSDERSEICQGKFGIPLVIFTLLLTLYIILGVIVFLNQNKDELHAKESPKLSKDELRELQKEYVALHEASNTKDFLEKYKECRQVLLEVVNVVELV
ncbi:Brainspecific angiogenesis inhibitor 1like, partial [Caligus rogercresseyi]